MSREQDAHEYDFSINGLRQDLQIRSPKTTGTPLKSRGRKQPSRSKARKAPTGNVSLGRPSKQLKTAQPSPLVRSSDFAPRLNPRPSSTHDQSKLPNPLEELPLELLEHIFLLCLNVNLPRASPRIGRLLSTNRMYKQFAYRTYCTNIKARKDDRISLASPEDLRHASAPERATKERQAVQKARSLGLTCCWTTYQFFRNLHEAVRKSDHLWLGLFSYCAIPSKLLRPPLSVTKRRLLLALVFHGAKLDNNTLAREEAEHLWLWAASVRDLELLQCMMEPKFGFHPDKTQRRAALQESGLNRDVLRVFRYTRAKDSKNALKWPEDWKKDWPLGVPALEVALSQKFGVDYLKLKEVIDEGETPRDWRMGFGGGEIPDPIPPKYVRPAPPCEPAPKVIPRSVRLL